VSPLGIDHGDQVVQLRVAISGDLLEASPKGIFNPELVLCPAMTTLRLTTRDFILHILHLRLVGYKVPLLQHELPVIRMRTPLEWGVQRGSEPRYGMSGDG
jgi:hypothetical protein